MRYIFQTAIAGSLVEVNVDDESVPVLWELGLQTACPDVQKLELVCYKPVESDVIRTMCSPFTKLTELHIQGDDPWPSIEESTSFCNALVSSCHQLVKLSIADINLGNDKTGDILRNSTVLEHLTAIT